MWKDFSTTISIASVFSQSPSPFDRDRNQTCQISIPRLGKKLRMEFCIKKNKDRFERNSRVRRNGCEWKIQTSYKAINQSWESCYDDGGYCIKTFFFLRYRRWKNITENHFIERSFRHHFSINRLIYCFFFFVETKVLFLSIGLKWSHKWPPCFFPFTMICFNWKNLSKENVFHRSLSICFSELHQDFHFEIFYSNLRHRSFLFKK